MGFDDEGFDNEGFGDEGFGDEMRIPIIISIHCPALKNKHSLLELYV